jgi:hypothetical protein
LLGPELFVLGEENTLNRCNKWNVKKTTLNRSKQELEGDKCGALKWCNQIRCGLLGLLQHFNNPSLLQST